MILQLTDLTDIFKLFVQGIGVGVVLSMFPWAIAYFLDLVFKTAKM